MKFLKLLLTFYLYERFMGKLELQFGKGVEAGTDEAGRGCLAGPVLAAAVVLPPDFYSPLLDDSKKLTEKQRYLLREEIETVALAFGVAECSPIEIDQWNILNASITAMHRALDILQIKIEGIAVDGNRFKPYKDIPHHTHIKGDGKFLNIAAASVLAKTYRDDFMKKIALEYPHYAWEKNKGYPTIAHREAIKKHGVSPWHRKSFRLLPEQLQIEF